MFPFRSMLALLFCVQLGAGEARATPTEGGAYAELTKVWQSEFGSVAKFHSPPATSPPAHLSPTSPVAASSRLLEQSDPRSDQPHPAVVRVVVSEPGAISYGSGTLIDIRDQYGLVITNWHVVRDAQGPVKVRFPGGHTSQARALKVDSDWDLAALVIWRPPVPPVKIAAQAPRPGDELTICGYGSGSYRSATGRCVDYYAPRPNFPRHMVELDVEARQGDSGGPIFNRQGELAGVLFGAGQGTTLGSFGGRVDAFLASLAPDIGHNGDGTLAEVPPPATNDPICCRPVAPPQAAPSATVKPVAPAEDLGQNSPPGNPSPSDTSLEAPPADDADANTAVANPASQWQPVARNTLFEQMKTALAAVGLLAIAVQVLRAAR